MSGPISPEAQLTAQAVVENAQRLGLTWALTVATVVGVNPITAVMDGDDTDIPVTSMVGPLANGQRVYVIVVPPSGNYVIGVIDVGAVTHGVAVRTGTIISAAAAETAVPAGNWTEIPTVVAPPQTIMKVEVMVAMFIGSATDSSISVRIRQGLASTGGTQLKFWSVPLNSNAGINAQSCHLVGYFKNSTAQTLTEFLSLTIAPLGGAVNVSAYSDANLPCVVAVSPYQPIGIDESLDAICVSLT